MWSRNYSHEKMRDNSMTAAQLLLCSTALVHRQDSAVHWAGIAGDERCPRKRQHSSFFFQTRNNMNYIQSTCAKLKIVVYSWSTWHNQLSSHLSSHLSLNREGCWDIKYDFATSFLHFSLFSTALWDLANSRPVHSLMLSSHIFLCLPCLLPHFNVPCKMVLARPDERETWPYHCSLCLFTMVRSSCGPIAS